MTLLVDADGNMLTMDDGLAHESCSVVCCGESDCSGFFQAHPCDLGMSQERCALPAAPLNVLWLRCDAVCANGDPLYEFDEAAQIWRGKTIKAIGWCFFLEDVTGTADAPPQGQIAPPGDPLLDERVVDCTGPCECIAEEVFFCVVPCNISKSLGTVPDVFVCGATVSAALDDGPCWVIRRDLGLGVQCLKARLGCSVVGRDNLPIGAIVLGDPPGTDGSEYGSCCDCASFMLGNNCQLQIINRPGWANRPGVEISGRFPTHCCCVRGTARGWLKYRKLWTKYHLPPSGQSGPSRTTEDIITGVLENGEMVWSGERIEIRMSDGRTNTIPISGSEAVECSWGTDIGIGFFGGVFGDTNAYTATFECKRFWIKGQSTNFSAAGDRSSSIEMEQTVVSVSEIGDCGGDCIETIASDPVVLPGPPPIDGPPTAPGDGGPGPLPPGTGGATGDLDDLLLSGTGFTRGCCG